MTTTVSWLARLPGLRLRVRAGSRFLRRDIRHVQTIEHAEPFEWLSGGELVLTTGVSLAAGADRVEYVHRMAESGIAALGFGVGLSFPTIPDDLLAAADEVGLAVLEVPRSTPFEAVSRAVLDQLAVARYDALLRAARAQPRMTRAMLADGAGALVRELAGALDGRVAVLDGSGGIVAAHPSGFAPDSLPTATADALTSTDSGGTSVTVLAIGRRSEHGRLVLAGAQPPGPESQILLGHAASLLALDAAKPDRVRAAQDRVDAAALALALEHGSTTGLESALGPDGLVRVLTLRSPDAATAHSVATAVVAALGAARRPGYVHREDARVHVLGPSSLDADTADRVLSALPSGDRARFTAGLSAPYPPEAIRAAADAATILAGTAERGGPVADSTDGAGALLLAPGPVRDALTRVAEHLLRPLREHDQMHGTALVESLRAYLEANGNWEAAAAAAGVHRHTLRARIGRIESLLGSDLSSARVRAELVLTLAAGA
ncbi:PucR family transcriptional regulator [Tsukamurella paurometabola]|uniref:Transcriptional regulator, PucR family n=1 Tax=Tsukamurella paurometabola (strain ATCC 8368 / DSM 20162 / CCUG 35730 / CIP 100753 / JCM 10117 / KCTC 9821 / NBRC 16120 / NCIMB 702349 / NCTC 13040) TaxID=521096 RepID=D5UWR4_TSUPD|nr:PucR family transcriptional regulator [Tsukamurella paurometabola]ADG77936.1 transcriptional regulator, PucR family [Tsukamurella paurometabola DSM 20162]